MSRISFRKESNKELRDELIHPGLNSNSTVVYDASMISEFEKQTPIPENKRLRIQTLVTQDNSYRIVGRRAYVENDIPPNAYLVHHYRESAGLALGYICVDDVCYDVYMLYGVLMSDDLNATDLKDGQTVIVDEGSGFKDYNGLTFYRVYTDEESFMDDILKDANSIKEFFTRKCKKYIEKVLRYNHEDPVIIRRIPPEED